MIQEVRINLIPAGIPPVAYYSQIDNKRKVRFYPYEGDQVYTIPAGANVIVSGKKPDGMLFAYDLESTLVDGTPIVQIEQSGTILVVSTPQMVACEGEVPCKINIMQDGENLGTLTYTAKVSAHPLADDQAASQADLPAVQSMLDEQIAECEDLLDEAEGVAESVIAAAGAADESARAAAASEAAAATSESNAATSETNAAASEAAAATSETNAAASATAAGTSEANAATSESNAATSETNAATSETNAAASATAAGTAATNAATSETNAAASATAAATSETNAASSASAAAGSATAAGTSETNAATSETNAASSASAAAASATAAGTSETNAATSESNAASSATAAAGSATAAAGSASDAALFATAAGTSETNAVASATAAGTSETNAATSESNAASSATAAAGSATAAAGSASDAAVSATAAAGSATAAGTSETNAAASATAASGSATAAAGSATAAAASESDSEAWAVGERGGVPVPSTDDTYHNNAKYWADQASQAAGGGVTSFNGRNGSVSPAAGDYTAAMVGAIPSTDKGSNSGVAELDANGKVPSSQLPSYVDDVIEGYYNTTDGKFYEESTYTTEITGETGKIYIDLSTENSYRWSGSVFVQISQSLTLGETSSTAYAGNKGKANADAITAIKDGTNIDSFGDVETALADKADKVSSATNGDLAGLDANGNLTDSGIPAANVADHDYVDSGDSAQEALTRASVGWSGKNQFRTDDITRDDGITVNSDGSAIRINNSTSATYRMGTFRMPVTQNTDYIFTTTAAYTSGGGRVAIADDAGTDIVLSDTFTENKAITISFNSGNNDYIRVKMLCTLGTATIGDITYNNVMLRDARIKDSTFEPYHESVDVCKFDRAEQRVLGAKNLYLFEASDVKANSSGTFTVSDGALTVTCAAVDYSGAYLQYQKLRPKFAGLVGIPCILSFIYKSSVSCNGRIGTSTDTIVLPTTWTRVEISISDPSQIDHVCFYNRDATAEPVISVKDFMLRLASDPDDTFATYTMTNKELTDVIEGDITTTFTKETASNQLTRVRRVGKVVDCEINLLNVTATAGETVIAAIPEGFRPTSVRFTMCLIDGSPNYCILLPNGNVWSGATITSKKVRIVTTWILD